MTLIASFVSPIFCSITSDKRITLSANGKISDDESNKMIVVARQNGLFGLCYTGLADLNGLTTDAFLASSICGRPPSDLIGMGIAFYPDLIFDDIGRCLLRLQLALSEKWKKLPFRMRRYPLHIVVTGFQFKMLRRPALPFWPVHYLLSKGWGHDASFRLTSEINRSLKRRWAFCRTLQIDSRFVDFRCYGSDKGLAEVQAAFDTLHLAKNVFETEEMIVKCIANVSRVDSTVGSIVNSLIFTPLHKEYFARIKCFHNHIGQNSRSFPWFISRNSCVQTMRDFSFDGFEMDMGLFKVKCEEG